MKKLCVYLGANLGHNEQFSDATILFAQQIAKMNHTLIYGGSSLGMMGLLATTVKKHGGKVIGISTKYLLDKEIPLRSLDELIVVNSMHERKQKMQELADVFVIMPGGIGTLEEAFETWNAIKIGVLNKKIGFLNINGYFDSLFEFIGTCEHSGLILNKHANIPLVHTNAQMLLENLTQLT